MLTGIKSDTDTIQAFEKENGLGYNVSAYSFTLSNLQVRRYKNGKLFINNFTKEQNKKVKRFFELSRLLR